MILPTERVVSERPINRRVRVIGYLACGIGIVLTLGSVIDFAIGNSHLELGVLVTGLGLVAAGLSILMSAGARGKSRTD